MSKRNKNRQANMPNAAQALDALSKSKKSFITADGYANVYAKLGINGDNQSSGGTYDFGNFITRNRLMLEAAYRTSWIIGQVVDVVADDMIRAGIDISSDLDPDSIDKLQRALVKLKVWKSLTSGIKWGRLYGGAAAIIIIEGQKMDQPLRIDTIGRDSFRGLLVLDRWLLNPSLGELVPEYGPDFGMPKYYQIIPTSTVLRNEKVHYSRVIRFDGIELPYLWKQAENLWSESVIERMYDRLLAFDSTTQGAAQLVFKAHLRTVKLKGLREALAAGGKLEDAITKEIEYIRRFQSNEGITLLDSEDEFETHQYTFAGLDSLLIQFGQQISGSTGIPLVRLFGQSPSGMNATGESDLRNYYDGINKNQSSMLGEPMMLILQCLAKSILGIDLPESTTISFSSLWQLTDKEKSEIAAADATSISTIYNSGMIGKHIALKELRQNSHLTGRYTNITDDDIEAAENEPEQVPGEELSPEGDLSDVEKTLKELVESDKNVHAEAGL